VGKVKKGVQQKRGKKGPVRRKILVNGVGKRKSESNAALVKMGKKKQGQGGYPLCPETGQGRRGWVNNFAGTLGKEGGGWGGKR